MANKNYYFKHYNNAHDGESIQSLLARKDYEAIACYWILLELVSMWESYDARGKIEVPLALLAKKWNTTCPKAERILDRLSVSVGSTFKRTLTESSPKVASIFISNWLEYQESRGGKRTSKFEQNMERLKTIDRDIDKNKTKQGETNVSSGEENKKTSSVGLSIPKEPSLHEMERRRKEWLRQIKVMEESEKKG